ncbi:MAG: hypothetical protein ACYCRD_08060 [Leptospirillum sp.]
MKEVSPESITNFIEAGKESARYLNLNEKSCMPMMGTLYERPIYVDDKFREGNVSPRTGTCRRLPTQSGIGGKRGGAVARVRADSAS